MDLQLLLSRVMRTLLLDERAIEELRLARAETLPAIIVVAVASFLAGLGGLIWTFTAATAANHARFFVRSFLFGSLFQIAAFFLWVLCTALVLQNVYHVRARYEDLVRVMGFAFAPVALQLVIFVPALDQPIGIVALAATLFTTTYAVQALSGASAGQSFTATLLGFAVFCAVLGILGNGATDLAPGLFALDPNSLSVGLTYPVLPVRR